MRHVLWYTLASIALGMAGLAVSPAGAETVAVGPYYAMPSWDQTLPASTRFIVLSNMSSAAVLDRETGLVWEKAPTTPASNWFDASFACHVLTTGSRMGWRLPTFYELASLLDPTAATTPPLPAGNPFVGIVAMFYWTATAIDAGPTRAQLVDFSVPAGAASPSGAAKTASTGFGGNSIFTWCVRGSVQTAPQ